MLHLEDVSIDTEPIKVKDDFDKRLKQQCNMLCKAAQLLCYPHFPDSTKKSAELNLLKQSKVIDNMCHDYLISKGKSKLSYEYMKSLVSVDVRKEDKGYRFIFGELFPSRGNIIDKSSLKSYSRLISHGYRPVLEKKIAQLKENDNIFFNERVAVVVTHFFADERQLKDYDNLESKPITDIITFHFIKDDSPQYMSLHFDYQLSDIPHSEVLITPEVEYFKMKSTSN